MSAGMSSDGETPDQAQSRSQRPDWADGLRQLYDSVVDEPLPDTFKNLLARLDYNDGVDKGCEADGSDGGHS